MTQLPWFPNKDAIRGDVVTVDVFTGWRNTQATSRWWEACTNLRWGSMSATTGMKSAIAVIDPEVEAAQRGEPGAPAVARACQLKAERTRNATQALPRLTRFNREPQEHPTGLT